MSNCLEHELNNIQNEYLNILKQLNEVPVEELSLSTIDSINIFWFEKINIVKLAFEYLFKEKDTYCFSGASYFDFNAKYQYGFFLLGDYHVFDDPLPDYLSTITNVSDKMFLGKMKKIISQTITDNIKLIEESNSHLHVLPLRHLTVVLNQNYKQLNKLAEKLFCDFFLDIENLDEYRNKILTLEDIVQHLEPQNASMILLFDGDNPLEDWESRFNKYLVNNDNYDVAKLSESEIFFMTIYSYLRQALAIISMEETFSVIPFLRSFIPLHYYVLISSSFESILTENKFFSKSNYKKTQLAYFVYQEYSRRDLNYSLSELKECSTDFENKLMNKLDVNNNSLEISKIIEETGGLLDDFSSV